MDQQYTELIFILDQSGSMYETAADVIGGFNSTLATQRQLPGECTVTTVLFNHAHTLLHDRLPISAVQPITGADYHPGGSTALLDAIGFALDKTAAAHRPLRPENKPAKVQFVIMTDGMENASREYALHTIRSRITKAREELGWDFIFLGANIDAVSAASQLGVAPDRAVEALPDRGGVKAQFAAVCRAAVAMRTNDDAMADTWAAPVLEDRESRS